MAEEFGVKPFTQEQIERLSFLPKSSIALLHCHRGFDTVTFDKPTYVYTGRGPSTASFHIGHLPGLQLCLNLQKHLAEPIVFMIADDEKMFRDGIDRSVMEENVRETIQQLRRIGFNADNTRFRINSDGFTAEEYGLLIQMLRIVSVNTLTQIFGAKPNIGEYLYPLIQILPCFSKGRQCVVVAGIDQDPFFRLARDISRRLGFTPPAVLYTRSVPGLDGSEKMSTSVSSSIPIFLTDSDDDIRVKVKRISVVGAGSLDELFERGADLTKDIPYRLIELFDPDSTNRTLLARAYTVGLTEDSDIAIVTALVPPKGIHQREVRTMLTSHGIRCYLTELLIREIKAITNKEC